MEGEHNTGKRPVCRFKKESPVNTGCRMEEPQKYHAEPKKPGAKGHTLYDTPRVE